MKIAKIRKVKTPVRAYSTTAGIDFFIPEDIPIEYMEQKNESLFIKSKMQSSMHRIQADTFISINNILTGIYLQPGDNVLIPSGIKANIPAGYALIARNKSGVASKLGLTVMADVVDSDYQGEIHLSVCNVTNTPCYVNAGDKLIQYVLIKISDEMVEVVDEALLFEGKTTERGSGGFGSTGQK